MARSCPGDQDTTVQPRFDYPRDHGQDAWAHAAEPKELVWVKGAGRVDLCDGVDLIRFDRLTAVFEEHLVA
jgi:hypothetical protein